MENEIAQDASQTVIGRMSWVPYVKLTVVTGIVVTLGYWITENYPVPPLYSGVSFAILITIYLYRLAVLRSYKLYLDDAGVWVYSGVLPWARGVQGVKWRDLDDASYWTGFAPWICNSYRVIINHRYTKANEIFMPHVWRGRRAVFTINRAHRDWIVSERISQEAMVPATA